MDLTRQKGVLIVLTDCRDSSKEQEFNAWYNDIHVGDVLRTGTYYAASRYAKSFSTGSGEGKFLAIYETEWEDADAAFQELRKHVPKMYLHPELDIVFVAPYIYSGSRHSETHTLVTTNQQKMETLLLAFLTNPNPTPEADFLSRPVEILNSRVENQVACHCFINAQAKAKDETRPYLEIYQVDPRGIYEPLGSVASKRDHRGGHFSVTYWAYFKRIL